MVPAMLLSNGKVVATGTVPEMIDRAGGEGRIQEVRDYGDATVLPGFIDSHLHVFWLGTLLLRQVDLTGCSDLPDLLNRLGKHGEHSEFPWILGRGWDQGRLREGREPTRRDLDSVFPNRPVLITRVCGHCAIANSVAINLLEPTESAAGDPETGRYTETAIAAFHRLIPTMTPEQQEEAVSRATKVAIAQGITTVGTLLDTADQMGAYHRLNQRGALQLRVVGMPPWTSVEALAANGVGTGFGSDQLRFGGAKLFADGSLGARTALLSSPYFDDTDPSNVGVRIYAPEELTRRVRVADSHGFQIVIHAIGDQAVREAVEAIESALDGRPNRLRHRIEHVSIAPPDLRQRIADAGIVAVVQPQFVTSDTWTGERIGPERSGHAYPLRALRDLGVPLALSSDCPVEALDSLALIAAAVWRHPWSLEGGLSMDEALHDYTLGSAFAIGMEDRVGSLEPGKWGDYVVLSDSPWSLTQAEWKRLRVEEVAIAGVVQERGNPS